ncbi:MAG: TonB-dependent receptor [Crocinitomicaceae bacterium]|nr:TonB-dependent receptor [Crocinitomicaceae bacterium]
MLLIISTTMECMIAQSTVKGTVTGSDSKERLAGVVIRVKGTTTGASTDSKGNFSIVVPQDKDVLVFSLIGYVNKEITIINQSEINVSLDVDNIQLGQVVVTGTQTSRAVSDIPKAITLVNAKELEEKNGSVSIIDALSDRAGIWVKKEGTALASDPQIRGFAGYYVNSLIDNNSLSTLAGEGGPAGSQILGKIDPLSVQQIEVIRGPSSVLYGTNAIGGVINIITKDPTPYTDGSFRLNGTIQSLNSSVDMGSNVRVEIGGSTSRVRFLAGGSYHNVNDVTVGGGFQEKLSPSSGTRYNIDFKSEFKLADEHFIQVAYQNLKLDKYHRYYFPNEITYNHRSGLSASYKTTARNFLWDDFTAGIYLQYKKDSLINYNGSNNYIYVPTTKSIAGDLRWRKQIGASNYLLYGLHYGVDNYVTRLSKDSAATWGKTAPDANWSDAAVYVQDEWNVSARFVVIPAFRYDYYVFKSRPDSLFTVPSGFTMNDFNISPTASAFSGGIGLLYHLPHYLNLTANVSRGFRQPRPDLGVSKSSLSVSVPSIHLTPETATTYELGLKTIQKKFRFAINAYYTTLQNFVTNMPGTYMGQDWFDWNKNGIRDVGENVTQKKNSAKGWVTGLEVEAKMKWNILFPTLNPGWFVSGGFNIMDGFDETNKQPLSKLSPTSGIVTIGFENPEGKRYWCYVSAFLADKFRKIPDAQKKTDQSLWINPQNSQAGILPYVPEYVVYTMRSGYAINENTLLSFSIENFSNLKYRVKDSRLDAPGINFVVGIKVKF